MSNKTDDLLCALNEYITTKQAHDEEMFKCANSWGYYGHSYIVALNKAESAFKSALESVIDERVEAALKALDYERR